MYKNCRISYLRLPAFLDQKTFVFNIEVIMPKGDLKYRLPNAVKIITIACRQNLEEA